MGEEKLELVAPTETLQESFLDMLDDYRRAGKERFQELREPAEQDFAALVRRWRDETQGMYPEDEWPEKIYWLVRDGREILGTCRLRPDIPSPVQMTFGHVGFDVRPSERRKGYATLILKLVLDKARALGMSRVSLVCSRENAASARVIQKNGGRLDHETYIAKWDVTIQQYWIDL